jgi:mannose-6-phosphate isomerase-like protein (cupin superfamily)
MMSQSTAPTGTYFSLRTPYLAEGRSNETVASTDQLAIRVKVYAEGGENALHAHEQEDHAFVVLEGKATFYDDDGAAREIGPYEGVMIPHGKYYRFESTGDQNLVLLRVGSGKPSSGNDRVGPDGSMLEGRSSANNNTPAVPIPGRFFGAPDTGCQT